MFKLGLNQWGQVLHIPNSELASARIVNQSQMTERKHQVELKLDYKTPVLKLKRMDAIFAEAIEGIENVYTLKNM